MLTEITAKPLKRIIDKRGSLAFNAGNDSVEAFQNAVCQANMSFSSSSAEVGVWHRNERGRIDCSPSIKGALQIRAYDDKTQSMDNVVPADECYQGVRAPSKYWHGSKEKGRDPTMLVYFMNHPHGLEVLDELHRLWIDRPIATTSINRRAEDLHFSMPWDWFE